MRWLLSLLLLLLVPAVVSAHPPVLTGPDGLPLRTSVNAQSFRQLGTVQRPVLSSKVSSPQAEALAALNHLQKIGKDPRVVRGERALSEIRFVSLFAVPPEQRWDLLIAMNLLVNSMSFEAEPIPLSPVPDTDGLLYWLYLSDYGWTDEAWEKLSGQDPYFREPWIDQRTAYDLRYAAGNAIVRADWVMDHASDTKINSIYYDMLFAKVKIERQQNGKKVVVTGQPPADLGELHRILKLDIKAAGDFRTDRGVMIPADESEVAFNNRILWRVPAITGAYWQTFDVLKTTGQKDFMEFRFPVEWDGSEIIYSLPNGLQGYLLANGQGKRVEFGPADLVKDSISPLSRFSVEVRTWQSCVACHPAGIRTAKDQMHDDLEGRLKLKEYREEKAKRTRLFYRGDEDLFIREDQDRFARAVKQACGTSPEEASRAFINAIVQYRSPVSLKQAALECGTTPEQLKAALSFGTKGQLGRLATNERAVNRRSWEEGLYSEAMGLLDSWRRRSGIASDNKPAVK